MRHKVLIASIIAAAIIFITGFNAVLLAGVWDPVWNPFRPDPEKILLQSFWKLSKAKTYHSSVEGSVNVQSEEVNARVSFSGEGPTDQTDKNMKLSEGKLAFDLTIDDGTERKNYSLEGAYKVKGEMAYLKATTVPQEIANAIGDASLSDALLTKWIKIDTNAILNKNLSEKDRKTYEEQIKLRKELSEKLIKLLSDPKFYNVIKTHPNENLEGMSTYHYTVDFNGRAFANDALPLIFDAVKAMQAQDPSLQGVPLDYAVGALQGMVDTFLVKIGPLQADVWIEKQTKFPRKITFNKSVDMSAIYPTLEGSIGINLVYEFSEFNKPVSIEMPADATPLEDLLEDLMDVAYGGVRAKARDAKRISDLRQMTMILESEDTTKPGNALTGCTKIGMNNTIVCTGPGDINYFKSFADPLNSPEEGLCSASNPQKGCQYAISGKNGTGRPKTNDYQICFYLERESSSYPVQGAIKGVQAIKSGAPLYPLKASPCTIQP